MTDLTTPAPDPRSAVATGVGFFRPKSFALLFLLCVICLAVGGLGAIATTPEIDSWYSQLEKPAGNPPNWVFGPVWTTLYILMALAIWLVAVRSGLQQARLALTLFAIQLALNLAWSWIFFGAHALGWAFVELLILWVAIAAMSVVYWQHSRIAALLMLPYLLWVSYAGYLNVSIWLMN